MAAGGLAGVGIAGLVTSCGAPTSATPSAGAVRETSLQLAWLTNVQFAGYYLAEDRGFYEAEGISPELLSGGPNLFITEPIVAGGRSSIGESTVLQNFIAGINGGADLVMFGAQYQTYPGGVMSLPQLPVRSAADLVGKRIGAPQGSQPLIDAYFNANDIPPDYVYIPTGSNAQPLLEGACDCLLGLSVNQGVELQIAGADPLFLSNADLGLPAYGAFLYSTRRYIDENRDVAVGFLRGTIKGWELNEREPEQGLQLTMDRYGAELGLDREQQRLQNLAQIPLLRGGIADSRGLFWLDVDRFAGPMYDGLRAIGVDSLPDPATAVDVTLLEDAYDGANTLLP